MAVADHAGAAQVGRLHQAAAEGQALHQVEGAVHVVGAGGAELAEEVKGLAAVVDDLDDHVGFVEKPAVALAQILLQLIHGQAGGLDGADEGQVDGAAAVDAAAADAVVAGDDRAAEFRLAGNVDEEHVSGADDVVGGGGIVGNQVGRNDHLVLLENGRIVDADGHRRPRRQVEVGGTGGAEKTGKADDEIQHMAMAEKRESHGFYPCLKCKNSFWLVARKRKIKSVYHRACEQVTGDW